VKFVSGNVLAGPMFQKMEKFRKSQETTTIRSVTGGFAPVGPVELVCFLIPIG
jgi:hypothetical protein